MAFAAEQSVSRENTLELEVSVSSNLATPAVHLATVAVATNLRWQTVAVGRGILAGQRLTFSARGEPQGHVLLADPAIEPEPRQAKPDLAIVVLIDTLRADHTSLLGYHLATTPALEELGHDGITFVDAHTPAPWTRPAVTSLLTSLDPDQHRVVDRVDKLSPEITTWAAVARREGFQTVAISTNPNILPLWGLASGFGRFVDSDSEHWGGNSDARKVFALAERAIDEAQLPLFLYLHVNDPHSPYDPPVESARQLFPDYSPNSPGRNPAPTDSDAVIRASIRRYDGEIRHADSAVGRFLEELRHRGLYDDAAIVVVGDHGEEFKEHGGTFHGKTVYEELLHVPLIIKLPKQRSAGRRINGFVSLVDVLPTLAETFAWPPPPGIEGHSLLNLVDGRGAARPLMTAFTQLDGTFTYGVLAAGYKLIRKVRPEQATLLFDLGTDPGEQRAITQPVQQAELLRLLEARFSRAQTGWHIRVCGGATSQRVKLDIDAVDGKVEPVGIESDDRIDGPDGAHQAHLEAVVGPVTLQRESFGKLIDVTRRDQDEIVFQAVRPTLHANTLPSGDTPQIRVGRDSVAAGGSMVVLDLPGSTIPPTEAPECSPTALDPTVFVWYIEPPAAAEKAEPDESTRERLRALGYGAD
ncbi:MAG: sulfatase [Deltaproteobacteria bacterium]|nr:sulfatase [Deltaproteobacteria bacterium]MBI3391500.1 sulfatase [Deltaproteobacteria bacterium]